MSWISDVNNFLNIKYKLRDEKDDYLPNRHNIFKNRLNGLTCLDIERFLKKKYHIIYNFITSHLTPSPLYYLNNENIDFDPSNVDQYEFMYSDNSIMIIFPNDGVRINMTDKFSKTITIINNILSGNWIDKFIQLTYYDYTNEQEYLGPKLIISYSPIEMFTYSPINEDDKINFINYSNSNESPTLRNSYFDQNNLLQSIRYALYTSNYCYSV